MKSGEIQLDSFPFFKEMLHKNGEYGSETFSVAFKHYLKLFSVETKCHGLNNFSHAQGKVAT